MSILLLEGSDSPLLAPQPGLVIGTVAMVVVVALVLVASVLVLRRLIR